MGAEVNNEQKNSEIDIVKDKKAKQAAYALNMCTVSISQILDYNDPVIMDQEYDGILNNLNIQNMPKESDALLDILEKIMDTITFFKISDKEKKFVEREYQENMKNAIWEAVPGFGMIVSGEPITMLISLATQVGMGYMNYRRAKNEKTLQYDREMWQLERAAIEQINSLQKQLFETAWRLSQTYDYEDRYRLSERQIKQYNEILIDADYERKYERLDSIKDNFEAYPPFWYYLANTANLIYCKYKNDEEAKSVSNIYKERACDYYEKYLSISAFPLLREDPMKASCCLEYIEMLDHKQDKDKIKKLIDIAVQSAGGRLDLTQLLVFAYLSIGETVLAKHKLLELINEDYNAATNAQLLSRIYVEEYLNALKDENDERTSDLYSLYKILSNRVNNAYLMPLPESNSSDINLLLKNFEFNQRQIVMKNYIYAFKEYFERKSLEYNRLIPVYSNEDYVSDEFYSNEKSYINARLKHAEKRIKSEGLVFCSELLDSEFWLSYLTFFDEIALEVDKLSCVTNIDSAIYFVEVKLKEYRESFVYLKKKLEDGNLTSDDYKKVANISFYDFFENFIKEICKQTVQLIQQLPKNVNEEERITIQDIERELRSFCVRNNLSCPEELYDDNSKVKTENRNRFFNESLLGEDNLEDKKRKKFMQEMTETVVKYRPRISAQSKKAKVNIFIKGEDDFKAYLNKIKGAYDLMNNAILIIDDKSSSDKDIVFAFDGIYSVVHKKIVAKTSYDDKRIGEKIKEKKIWINGINKPVLNVRDVAITTGMIATGMGSVGLAYAASGKVKQIIVGDYFDNKEIIIFELYQLIRELRDIFDRYNDNLEKKYNDGIALYGEVYKLLDEGNQGINNLGFWGTDKKWTREELRALPVFDGLTEREFADKLGEAINLKEIILHWELDRKYYYEICSAKYI